MSLDLSNYAVRSVKYWQMMGLIVLPQASKISIPGIVNTFIGLFKDTTLVIVIGLFDILNMGNSMVSNPNWLGLSTEAYVFISLFFFTVCFSMSRPPSWGIQWPPVSGSVWP